MTPKIPPNNAIIDNSATTKTDNGDITYYVNTKQNYITIPEERLRGYIAAYVVEHKKSRAWEMPVGVLATILASLATTDTFKPAFGIDASTWHAAFVLSSMFFLAWTAKCLWSNGEMALQDWRNKTNCVDRLIKKCREGN